MMQRLLLVLVVSLLGFLPSSFVLAQERESVQQDTMIDSISAVATTPSGSFNYVFQTTDLEGKPVSIDTSVSYPEGLWFRLEKGNPVTLRAVPSEERMTYYFEDVVRASTLWWIAGLFVLITLVVGWLRGFLALIGFIITTLLLFGFLFPQILAGRDPVLMTSIASIAILGVNIHLAHGFQRRTFYAFLGTVVGIALTALFSYWFTASSKLSGVGTDDAALLLADVPTILNPLSIFLSAIILGSVGVLDDIAINQSEIVSELQQSNPGLSRKELYKKAMRIGRHHIASTVNTLILVYVGAAMPMFLLAMHYSIGLDRFLNTEAVAEEIVRIFAGTSALVLTVPIATWFATLPGAHSSTHVSEKHA